MASDDRKYGTAAGSVNVYTCGKCGKKLSTVHVDDGTTPFMIVCKRTEGCRGFATSGFYQPTTLAPLAEWYKPAAGDPCLLDEGVSEHVAAGGLMLRMKKAVTP